MPQQENTNYINMYNMYLFLYKNENAIKNLVVIKSLHLQYKNMYLRMPSVSTGNHQRHQYIILSKNVCSKYFQDAQLYLKLTVK